MREIEQLDITIPDPIAMNEEIVRSIREISGWGVFFHFAIMSGGLAFGLFETQEEAERKIRLLQADHESYFYLMTEGALNRPHQIVALKIGDQFDECAGTYYRHGIDDGHHGSQKREWSLS